MTNTDGGKHLRPDSPATYRIEVEGQLSEGWADYFAGMSITTRTRADGSVVTCLTGRIQDQSELTGMLDALAGFHLPILSVNTIELADHDGT